MSTKNATFAEAVEARISTDISSGRLAPGTRLRLNELCEAYDVSMSPLREALSRLGGLGFVVQEHQRGFRVAPVSIDDLNDITETRIRLESMALSMAIHAGGAEWEAKILASHHLLSRHPRTSKNLSDEMWESLHRAFHLSLLEACGSPRLLSFCLALLDHFDRYRRIAVKHGKRHPILKKANDAALVAAVLAKETDKALLLLVEHINEGRDVIVKLAGPAGFSHVSK